MKDVQAYIDLVASKMNLGHWNIKVLDGPPEDEDAIATIDPWLGMRRAYVRFADNFLTADPEDQREVVVHELVHLYHAHTDRVIRDDLYLSTDMRAAYRIASENAVEVIASAMAGFMPLPSEAP